MYWTLFFFASLLAAFALIPFGQWKTLWPAGLVAILTLFIIDSTLVSLNAYHFRGMDTGYISEIPIVYLLSSFPGGMLLYHFYPKQPDKHIIYILVTTMMFIGLETIMNILGSFIYDHWNVLYSFALDFIGFTFVLSATNMLVSLMWKGRQT